MKNARPMIGLAGHCAPVAAVAGVGAVVAHHEVVPRGHAERLVERPRRVGLGARVRVGRVGRLGYAVDLVDEGSRCPHAVHKEVPVVHRDHVAGQSDDALDQNVGSGPGAVKDDDVAAPTGR